MANDKTPSPENKVASAYVEVTTTGIPEVKQQLEQVKKAAEDVATSQEAGQKKAAAATKQTEGSFDDLVKALSGDAKQAVDKASESMAGGQKKVKDATKETAKEAKTMGASFSEAAAIAAAFVGVAEIISDMAVKISRVNEELEIMRFRKEQLDARGASNLANSPMTTAENVSFAGIDQQGFAGMEKEIAIRSGRVAKDDAIQAFRGDIMDNPLLAAASAFKTATQILPESFRPTLGMSDDINSAAYVPTLIDMISSNNNMDDRRKELNTARNARSAFSPRLQAARAGRFTTQSNYEQQRGTLDAMQNMTLNDSSEATQELLRQILSELKRGSMRP